MSVADGLQTANALWAKGDLAGACAVCREIIAAHPEQPDALHMLGVILHNQGQISDGIALVRRACAAPGANAVCFTNFTEMCRRAGLLSEGVATGRRAVALAPHHATAWNNLGIVLQEAGDFADSLACLERVLALTPDSPVAHNNFANSCKCLGRLGLARTHWERALALREEYAEPHSNLATLLTDLGDYEAAEAHARRAIALKPAFADAYLNLAGVQSAREDFAGALDVLDRLLALEPGHVGARAARALSLKQLGRLHDALADARQAVAAAPDNADAVHALAQVAHAAGESEVARAAYVKAAALPGTAAEKASVGHALMLMELGETAAANDIFDATLARFPRSAAAYYNRADARRYAPDDPAIAAMTQLLEEGCEAAHDRMLLHFALGNAHLQVGEAAQAFRYLDAGNRMKRAQIAYDPDAIDRWMDSIARTLDAGTLARWAGVGHASARSVFVLGMPRSGTTLVEQILASHPAIFGAGELSAVAQATGGMGNYPGLVPSLDEAGLQAMGVAYEGIVDQLTRGAARGRRYVVDKMPANFLYAGLIHLMLPAARIIHCRRDPVDTCLSCYSKLFTREQLFTYDQAELGRFYRGYERLMAHWRGVLPAKHSLDVTYEDVVADLEGQVRRMLDFLELPFDPACLRFYDTPRTVKTASVNQVRQKIYARSAGRWRRFEGFLGPLLGELRKAEKKHVLFEKKNQKTFMNWHPPVSAHDVNKLKVFCFFFSKKKTLSCFIIVRAA